MPTIVIASYKPKPGMEAKLLDLLKRHTPALKAEGLITDYPATFMKSDDGVYAEIFEWISQDAAQSAHSNAVIGPMWEEYAAVSDFVPLATVEQTQTPFAHFEQFML